MVQYPVAGSTDVPIAFGRSVTCDGSGSRIRSRSGYSNRTIASEPLPSPEPIDATRPALSSVTSDWMPDVEPHGGC